jgi:flavin reductase (DIM6/NTAB) family NADH-FMN oxidoreductase RutF
MKGVAMATDFMRIDPYKLKDNVFKLIDLDWMLVTAGTPERWNTMTASWGGLGVLWNRPVSFVFVRPTRYTYEFMQENERFTLSFFTKTYRKALVFCGSKSGRDCDKAKETGLEPVSLFKDTVAFRQARLVLVCRKLYTTDIDPRRFLDPKTDIHYPKKDYHRVYIGEITRCLVNAARSTPYARRGNSTSGIVHRG